MTMQENEFDRQMRKKLDGYTPEPSPGLWDKIAARLDEQAATEKPVVVMPPVRRRQGGWWWSAAAVVLLGAFAWVLYQPVEIVYLKGQVASVAEAETIEILATATPEQAAEAEMPTKPRQLAPILKLYAERVRPETSAANPVEDMHGSEELRVAAVPDSPVDVQTTLPAVMNEPHEPVADVRRNEQLLVAPLPVEAYAHVAELPIVAANLGETEVVDRSQERTFGVGSLLNIVLGSVDQREEKLVTFSDDDEGLIKMAFNLGRGRVWRNDQ